MTASPSISLSLLEDAMKKLSAEKAFETMEVDVQRRGTQIILPDGMSTQNGIDCLTRKLKSDESQVRIHEEVEAFPLDGAYALMQVLRGMFGWAEAIPKKTFFGDIPPALVTLEIGVGKTTQIIWGDFMIPGIEGKLTTGRTEKNHQTIFVIAGQVKQKHKEEVKKIADAVRKYVKENSIYKGKAIRLHTNDEGHIDFESPPKFMDVMTVNENELIFSDRVMDQVNTSLFTPIEKTAHCRKYNIPLRRGVLLEGPYGTGKTLAAYVTAKKCQENGWTFLYVDRVAGLKEAFTFAKQYMPCAIFAEDIDRVVTGERSVEIDDVLNNIDGVDSKGSEIITILTSNHADRINRAMLRPGRLDAIVSVSAPDAPAVAKLMHLYSRGLIAKDTDLTGAAKELAGQIPAVIREVVERSKLYAISRLGENEELRLQGEDLASAARGMKNHLALLAEPKKEVETIEHRFGAALGSVVKQTLGTDFSKFESELVDVDERLDKVEQRIN